MSQRKRRKIILNTTLSAETHQQLTVVSEKTGVAKNALIEQALLSLFQNINNTNDKATAQTVALKR